MEDELICAHTREALEQNDGMKPYRVVVLQDCNCNNCKPVIATPRR